MSQKKLLNLVEALREAGQQFHRHELDPCDERGVRLKCDCGAERHNAAVDAAAKALVAEIEKQPWEQFPLKNPQEILHMPEVP